MPLLFVCMRLAWQVDTLPMLQILQMLDYRGRHLSAVLFAAAIKELCCCPKKRRAHVYTEQSVNMWDYLSKHAVDGAEAGHETVPAICSALCCL